MMSEPDAPPMFGFVVHGSVGGRSPSKVIVVACARFGVPPHRACWICASVAHGPTPPVPEAAVQLLPSLPPGPAKKFTTLHAGGLTGVPELARIVFSCG